MANLSWFVSSIVVPAAVCFLAFWLFFQMPLGRRQTFVKRTLKAPVETVWQLVDPRNLDFSWNPHWEKRDFRKVGDDPFTVEYRARPKGGQGEFRLRSEMWTRIEPGRALTSCDLGHPDSPQEESALSFEHLNLAATADGATRVVLSVEGPMRGLFGYELRRMSLTKYLAVLDAAARGCAPAKGASIRFAGWKSTLLTYLSLFALLGGSLFFKPFDGGAFSTMALVTATLLFALILHELGHALALFCMGHRDVTISLIPFVGGVAASPRNYESAFEAGLVAIAGVAFSAFVCLALLPFLPYLSTTMESLVLAQGDDKAVIVAGLRNNPLPYIALCAFGVVAWQLVVNLFNILPFPGSDGLLLLQTVFSDRRARWIAAACVCVLVCVMARSPAIPVALAVFWALSLVLARRAKKLPAWEARACSQRQRLALVGIFAAVTACLGYEASATQTFTSRVKSLHILSEAQHAALTPSPPAGLHRVVDEGLTPAMDFDRRK